jgi:general secretion pathway protein L
MMQTLPTEPAPDEQEEGVAEAARMLVVPGSEVAIHWLDLAEGLTQPQAAAAARLLLADASAEPVAGMHVAIGRPERGLTPVALTPIARMAEWIEGDPDIVLPSPFLLPVPAEGLIRRAGDAGVSDYRGQAAAFSVEPALAALLVGDAAVVDADDAMVDVGLVGALEAPALNLRQGAFAKRRRWAVDRTSLRRVALLVAALAAISLILQLAAIMRYSFAADRLEAEAAALGASSSGGERGPGFTPLASVLFDSVRAIPNVELVRIDYRPDGSLAAIVAVDNPATLAILRRHVEASGLNVEAGAMQSGARPSAELVLRPA